MAASHALTPLLCLGGGAFLIYLISRVITRRNRPLAALTSVTYGAALASTLWLWNQVRKGEYPAWSPIGTASPMILVEPGALLLAIVTLSLGLLVAIYSGQYLALDRRYEDYYPLLLLLSAGVVGLVMAADLFTLYLFTVLASAAAYVLVAFRRSTETAIEAGFKYLIIGGLGAVLILTGVGHIYRETGTLTLPLKAVNKGLWSRVGMAFIAGGYAIKSALVPVHTWLPDAHGRAPSSVSALLSGILIQANLYALVKVGLGLGWPPRQLGWLLLALSLLNMTVGNVLALVQDYGKRLLGYSSIAQVGYVMMAFGVGLIYNQPAALSAGLFLIVAHAAMKGLAFLCKGICHFYCQATLIEELHGIGRRVPITSGCFVVAIAGLVGIPPLAGFTGKWQILSSMLENADVVVWAAIAALVLNSLVSLGYYLRLIWLIVSPTNAENDRVHVSNWMLLPIIVLAGLVVLIGVYPGPVLGLADEAGRFLLAWGD